MIVETSGTMAPKITSDVIVWDDIKRIDIINHLNKTLTYDKEGVYFAFPFAGPAADLPLRGARPAIVNANKDMLPGACLDWFTVQHFVEIEGRDAAIAWATPDAPLVCFQDINRGKWQTKLAHDHRPPVRLRDEQLLAHQLPGRPGGRLHVPLRHHQPAEGRQRGLGPVRLGGVQSASGAWPSRPNPAGPAAREPDQPRLGRRAERDRHRHQAGRRGRRRWSCGSGSLPARPTTAHLRLDRHIPAAKAEACNLVEEPQEPLEIRDGQWPCRSAAAAWPRCGSNSRSESPITRNSTAACGRTSAHAGYFNPTFPSSSTIGKGSRPQASEFYQSTPSQRLIRNEIRQAKPRRLVRGEGDGLGLSGFLQRQGADGARR